jgi:hypothetical protein
VTVTAALDWQLLVVQGELSQQWQVESDGAGEVNGPVAGGPQRPEPRAFERQLPDQPSRRTQRPVGVDVRVVEKVGDRLPGRA